MSQANKEITLFVPGTESEIREIMTAVYKGEMFPEEGRPDEWDGKEADLFALEHGWGLPDLKKLIEGDSEEAG